MLLVVCLTVVNKESNVLCVFWAIALSTEQEVLSAKRAEKFEYVCSIAMIEV